MGTITKKEDQSNVIFTLRVSKKQIRLLIILLTSTFVAGVALFFLKNF